MLPFITAIETLRITNRRADKPLYEWQVIISEGISVVASNGMQQRADYTASDALDYPVIFVCGPFEPRELDDRAGMNWLKTQARQGALIGGIETGSYMLAKAGLLAGRQSTIHWENMLEFEQDFPALEITSDVFEVDGDRISCSGGTASLDMMLYLIERQHGHELAAQVAESMIHPHIRTPDEPQRMCLQARIGVDHPALLECIELMEANIEEPLGPIELADLIKISKRQLERLFQRYLNNTPCRYYLGLRLDAANKMLKTSSTSVLDIALACGFKSPGHFSTCYLSRYGITPRAGRQ
jgi:transcriptional regulator GlxA family with amidase domain